jgi:vitamin B12 transporter
MSLVFSLRRAALARTSLSLAALAACGAHQAAVAQSTLAPIVVTAARVEQKTDDSFVAVTVLGREQIEASQAPDLVSLLRSQAGVEITQQGGYGTQASAFIRGGESRHTLVLVDGVPLSTSPVFTAAARSAG